MADTRGIITQKSTANTPSLITVGTTIVTNSARSAWAIQNVGTAVLFVTLGSTGSSTVYHFALKASTANDDGTGGSVSQTNGVVYTGPITMSVTGANPVRFVMMEIS